MAVLLSLWGWDAYRQRQGRLAAQEYSRAFNLYRSGQLRQAIDSFAHLKTYGSSPYSQLALLYQAHGFVALDEPAKAAAALQEFLKREKKDTLFRQLGLLTLAYLQENRGGCTEAARNFAAAQTAAGPFKEEALLGKARCSFHNGDFKEALNSYRQYLTSYPGSERSSEISLRIPEIEEKVGAGKGAK